MLTTSDLLACKGKQFSSCSKSQLKNIGPLSGFLPNVVESFMGIHAGIEGNTLKLENAGLGGSDGIFVPNEDDKVMAGILTRDGVIVSDQFAGCDMTILRGGSAIIGTHVYSSDACRNAIAKPPGNWVTVGTWTSKGYLEKWPGIGGLFAFAVVTGRHCDIVALGLKGYPPQISNVELGASFDW